MFDAYLFASVALALLMMLGVQRARRRRRSTIAGMLTGKRPCAVRVR